MAGNDLRSMSKETRDILTNREVIAIDQDASGKQGRRVLKDGDQEVWERPLSDGGQALAMFNRSGTPATISLKWSDLGLKSAPARARDLWAHSDVKVEGAQYTVAVPAHGVKMLRVAK